MTSSPPLTGMIVDEALFAPLMGLVVGAGSSRVVVECRGHPDIVIKIGFRHAQAGNWTEWNLWHQIKDEETLSPLFGECFAMSASGRYLLMERLNNLTDEQAPTRLCPPWVTDKKRTAFGVSVTGDIKLRDYGQLALGPFLSKFPGQPAPR